MRAVAHRSRVSFDHPAATTRTTAMAAEVEPARASVAARLDRHERRRRVGVPTVSLLVGMGPSTLGAARRWAGRSGRPVVRLAGVDHGAAPEAWFDRLAIGRSLDLDAADWLDRRSGRGGSSTTPGEIGRMTPFELGMRLDAALADDRSDPAEACRWLLGLAVANEQPMLINLAGRLDPNPGGMRRAVGAIRALVPEGRDPIVLLATTGPDDKAADRVESAGRFLAGWAEADPGMTLLLATSPAGQARLDRLAPGTRLGAILGESVVAVASARTDETAPVPPILVKIDVPKVVRKLFVAAAVAENKTGVDRARSAVERFLFALLQSIPETAGLFRLNAGTGFRFGPTREMEVDLLAESLQLAVEIDGYHHFRGPDDYRRDRRKDVELQRHGYFVLRVLADDVVGRLEDVLDAILAEVADRRRRVGSTSL